MENKSENLYLIRLANGTVVACQNWIQLEGRRLVAVLVPHDEKQLPYTCSINEEGIVEGPAILGANTVLRIGVDLPIYPAVIDY